MFVALKDLVFARGRFALIGAVIALLTMMVVLLSGLTAGLGRGSTSAIVDLPADQLVFAAPAGGSSLSFDASHLDAATVAAVARVPGVRDATPLTIAMSRANTSGGAGKTAAVAVFATPAASSLAPADVTSGGLVLSADAADALHATTGDSVQVGEQAFTVAAVAGDGSYSHAPVIWMTQPDAARAIPGIVPGGATVVAVTTDAPKKLSAADNRLHTVTRSPADAVDAIGSYSAENGSLQLMRALLLAISALVVGAFFTVWTVQRSGDIAVLKALGASHGYLVRDALGQALVLLLAGTGVGTAVAAGLGALAATAVPFEITAMTVVLPAVAMVVLGLVGAAASLRRVTTVDPLTALGSAR